MLPLRQALPCQFWSPTRQLRPFFPAFCAGHAAQLLSLSAQTSASHYHPAPHFAASSPGCRVFQSDGHGSAARSGQRTTYSRSPKISRRLVASFQPDRFLCLVTRLAQDCPGPSPQRNQQRSGVELPTHVPFRRQIIKQWFHFCATSLPGADHSPPAILTKAARNPCAFSADTSSAEHVKCNTLIVRFVHYAAKAQLAATSGQGLGSNNAMIRQAKALGRSSMITGSHRYTRNSCIHQKMRYIRAKVESACWDW